MLLPPVMFRTTRSYLQLDTTLIVCPVLQEIENGAEITWYY
jgi:hypothetical protein